MAGVSVTLGSLLLLSVPCTSIASFSEPAGLRAQSTSLGSSVRRIAWLGASNVTCDSKCRQGCSGLGGEGDSAIQRVDGCVAGCGCGGGSQRVLVATEAGEARLSEDAGVHWKDLGAVLRPVQARGPWRVEQLHVSHADPDRVAVITNTSTSWVSADGGRTWKDTRLATKDHRARRILAWRWHPAIKDLAIVEGPKLKLRLAPAAAAAADPAAPAAAARPPAPAAAVRGAAEPAEGGRELETRRKNAFYTKDGGLSWTMLATNVDQCHWALTSGGAPHRIILTRHVKEEAADGAVLQVLATDNFMATHTVLLAAAARVHIHSHFVAAMVPETTGASQGGSRGRLQLMLYTEDGKGQARFQVAVWPGNVGPMLPRQLRHLQVLHAAEHMTLLFVPASDARLPWGHVFGCAPGSAELELLLTDVHDRGLLEGLAWHAVAGLDGVFLANRVVLDKGQDLDVAEGTFDGQAEAAQEDRDDGENDGALSESEESSLPAEDRYVIRTYVSVNMGLAWQPLAAPEALGTTAQASCRPQAGATKRSPCSLHLASWASASSAPGILLGRGNVGLRLSSNVDHHGIFLSRDAGLTWRAALQGPHMVTILGHGDVLLAVPFKAPNVVRYSKDGGSEWVTLDAVAAVDGQASAVRGLFTHPAHAELQALVALGNDGAEGTTLASIDLASVLPTACRLPDDPSNIGSDFERWSPADALEDAHVSKRPACLLGARTSYIRRKAGRSCKTGVVRPAALDLRKDTPCQCTAADWACDTGFHRASYSAGSACEPLEGTLQPNISALCAATAEEHILVTRGYAKSPGNRCSGGVDLSPLQELCPGNAGLRGAVRRMIARNGTFPVSLITFLLCVALVLHALRSRGGPPSELGLKIRRLGFTSYGKRQEDDEEETEFLLPGRK